MPRQRFENNAKSTLSVAVSSNTQATLTLQSGHGARFPYLAVPDFFDVTLDDGTNIEICKCIDRSGDALTVLRGQQETTAQASFATGTKVELRLTRDGVRRAELFQPNQCFMIRPSLTTNSWQFQGLGVPTTIGSWAALTMNNSEWKLTQPIQRGTATQSAQVPLHMRVPMGICNVGRGFRYKQRFGTNLAPNSSHFFFGLVGTSGAVTSVHPPSSLTNAIVVGWANATQNVNLSIWRNDASGNAVQLDLGSYFTCSSFAAFEVELSAVGGQARIDYTVRRLDISSISDVSSFFTTDIPPNSIFLAPYLQMTSMVTSAPQLDFMNFQMDV